MRTISIVISLAAFALGGCAAHTDVSALKASIDELKKQQQVMIEDLRKERRHELDQVRAQLQEIKEKQDQLDKKVADAAKPPSRPPRRRGQPDPAAVYAFPIGDSPYRGKKDAWVTVVEISDYQCPYCKRVQATLDQLLEKNGDDLRVVFKHNPLGFHPRALPAAMASECAREQGLFWPVHDLLFENNRNLEDDDMADYVRQAGQISMKRWKSCYEGSKHKERIKEDQRIANQLGARGTPSFFINGRFLSGSQPLESFQSLVEEELKKAKESGISRQDYYRRAVEEKGEKKP